jgi:hypothetical protein
MCAAVSIIALLISKLLLIFYCISFQFLVLVLGFNKHVLYAGTLWRIFKQSANFLLLHFGGFSLATLSLKFTFKICSPNLLREYMPISVVERTLNSKLRSFSSSSDKKSRQTAISLSSWCSYDGLRLKTKVLKSILPISGTRQTRSTAASWFVAVILELLCLITELIHPLTS